MQFKNYYEHKTSINNTLDKVFKDLKLLFNSFIDKGRCGIGGTWLALFYAHHTIITVPNRSIIASKLLEVDKYPYGIFPIQGGVTVEAIKTYLIDTLTTPGSYIKIMVIPDSFDKLIDAAIEVAKEIIDFNIHRDCFLLLDECHTFITEDYRGKILRPFKHFWDFTNKSVISATPYKFSDPRFAQMDYHKVTFHEQYLGKINVVNCTSVKATLLKILQSPQAFPGKVFIFLNSVKDSIETIKRSGQTDIAMFYADSDENHEKLQGYEHFYEADTSPENYRKFNFFTCKYFEGWDLYEKNATMIFVTDIHSPNTKSSISIKGIQAVGRLRVKSDYKEDKPHNIFHLTNIKPIPNMKTQEEFEMAYKLITDIYISQYNSLIDLAMPILPDLAKSIDKFADIDPTTKKAMLNSNKFDQEVCTALINEEYSSIQNICDIWAKGGYETTLKQHKEQLQLTKRKEKRMSQADKLKALVAEFARLEAEKEETPFNLGYDELNNLIAANPETYRQFTKLGAETMDKLKYNTKAIKTEMIERSNYSAEGKIRQMLSSYFVVGERYTKDQIKTTLQRIYNRVQLLNRDGSAKIANAEQLGDFGRYEIHPCKVNVNGKSVNGFQILRAQFELRVAA